jgi:hypothetical protein
MILEIHHKFFISFGLIQDLQIPDLAMANFDKVNTTVT